MRFLLLPILLWAGLSWLSTAHASTQTLESTALRLEVDDSPFSYRVLEKPTSTLLLSQATNAFSFGSTAYGVSVATNFLVTSTTFEAQLRLAGTSAVARVNFSFTQPEILQVTFISTNGASQILQQFNDQGENVYGVWEYPFGGRLDIRGIDQPFLGVSVVTNINYCSARAPFYLTSRQYGIYVESDAEGRFTVAVNNRTGFSFNAPQLQFHVIYGPACSKILARYNAIAGGSYMPPTWAFSTLWWKDDDHANFHAGVTNAQSNVLDTAIQLRSYHIPASALWIDRPYGTGGGGKGWGNFDFDSSFPNPSQMVSNLNAMGMNVMLWIANRCWDPSYLYTNGLASGYLFSSASGSAADLRITNAYTWLRSNLNAFVNLGIKGYKIDRGEEGEQPDSVQNRNITLLHKLAFEGQSAVHSNDTLLFARNVCDTSRKYSAVWNGDTTSTFAGLQYSIISGLRSGLINFPMWGSDTGGYNNGPPTEELFARWLEFSAYSPMMEILIGNSRTPWYDYSTNLVAIARKQAADHHDLLPYARSYLYKATQTGLPLMRPLFLACPGDASVTNTWDEYLYGEKLLVAPVVTAGATNRSVYLPAGNWINYNTRFGTCAGPTNFIVAAPLDTIPLFVNEGAIIPRGDILRANNNWTANWSPQLRIEFFPSDTFSSRFDYYTGSTVQTITCSNQNHTLAIQFGDLGLNGNLEIYLGAFGGVSRNGTNLTPEIDYSYDPAQRLLRVPFNGATTLAVAAARSLFAPIEFWRTVRFGGAVSNPAVSGDFADPDGDQVPNFLEYALGLDPLSASTEGLPFVKILNDSGNSYLALIFQRSTSATDTTFAIRTSGDLIQWLSGSSYSGSNTIPVTATTTEVSRRLTNGIETITVRDNTPVNSAARRFMMMRVSNP